MEKGVKKWSETGVKDIGIYRKELHCYAAARIKLREIHFHLHARSVFGAQWSTSQQKRVTACHMTMLSHGHNSLPPV